MRNKSLKNQLKAQFYRGNRLTFGFSVFAALSVGSMALIVSWLMQQLIDAAGGATNAMPLGALAWLTGGFMILCVALKLLDYAFEPRFIEKAIRQYRDFAFQKLTEKSISSFRDESTATYLSALTNDAASVEADYLSQQLSVITNAVKFLGALALMLWFSPLLTAIAAALTVLPMIASLLTGNRLQAAERRVSDRNRDFTAALADCLSGFTVVKTFKAEREIVRLFAESNRALEKEKFDRRRLKALVSLIGGMAGVAAQLGVLLAGAYLALTGAGVTAGMVIMFVNLMNYVIAPIAQLPSLLSGRKAALGLIDRLAAALEKNVAPEGGARVSKLTRGITLEGVSFGYDGGRDVLRDISAEFEAGKAYAIVGGSGSGKSTLLHLLMAGSADYRGKIHLDDTEIRSVAPESLYELMSVIQQNVFVFNASIRDNVTMFRDFPQDRLESAIQHAHLRELLTRRGEDSLCGEN